MRKRTIALLVLFVILTWAGAAGIAYGVVQGAEGPQGEQGEQGERGPKGATGPAGLSNTDTQTSSALFRLASMWSIGSIAEDRGEFITGAHPAVLACLEYILTGEGSPVECGFERAP